MKSETAIKKINQKFPGVWTKPGHEFDGGNALVWSGEGSEMPDGNPAFDAYGDQGFYTFGVHRDLYNWAEDNGLYWEAYDSGTFLLYEQ